MRRSAMVLLCLAGTTIPAEAGIKLKAIRFPIDLTDPSGPKTPPIAAPLSQPVVFEFTGTPKIGPGVPDGLRIRVAGSNVEGQPANEMAFGTYKVSGKTVVFTPRLPTSPFPPGYGPATDIASDTTMPGLRPDTLYEVSVTVGGSNSVKNLTNDGGIAFPILFRTTPGVPGAFEVQSFFSNAPLVGPKLKAGKTLPTPGTSNIFPNLFNDPANLFSSIPTHKRLPFRLMFKGPLDPSESNISLDHFRVRAVAGPSGVPADLSISSTAVMVANSVKSSEVLVYPDGILPLGYTVVLEVSDKLRALSGAELDPAPGAGSFEVAGSYTIAKDPNPGSPMDDFLFEDFKTTDHQDTSIAGGSGEFLQLASWDAANSNNLRATFGFGGDGSLGRFLPPDDAITITLDTDFQQLPLFSGATPDVAAGTVVKGGVFNFSEFTLPPNVILTGRGGNPLIITVTGNAIIQGVINLDGQDGTKDDTFDSAITPTPGGSPGVGGGRGGDSHPVFVPAGATSLKFIQTPQFGQSGFAPGNKVVGGGGGGQCGATLPWKPFTTEACTQYSPVGDGSRGSGGGGGSFGVFLPTAPEPVSIPVSGRRGGVGAGNHLPVEFNANQPIPGVAGTATEAFAYSAGEGPQTENAVAKKNPNPTFQEAYHAGLIYDKGTQMPVDNPTTGVWAQTTKITFQGAAGPAVFSDADPDNNYIGPGGELSSVRGGQGGGGSGSRSEGLSQKCKKVIFDQAGLPFTVLDSKGGGGGGAGGGILMQVLGTLTLEGPNAQILARGGAGAGGEQTGASNRGGSGGSGSGGCVILQSATKVFMNDAALPATVIDVSGGVGHDAATISAANGAGVANGEIGVLQFGDGGPGGPGIVQIHTPDTTAVDTTAINAKVILSAFEIRAVGQTDFNPLVPMNKTPTPLSPRSVARSTWYDLGSVTSDFRPPIVTAGGSLAGPIFGIPGIGPFFRGTDPNTGRVLTDSAGNVLDPFEIDLDVDAPDLLADNFIPNGPTYFQSVEVRFQGADEDTANPGSPDLASATTFETDITSVNGKRFIRWQVDFDIASGGGGVPQPSTPRPQVNFLRIPLKY